MKNYVYISDYVVNDFSELIKFLSQVSKSKFKGGKRQNLYLLSLQNLNTFFKWGVLVINNENNKSDDHNLEINIKFKSAFFY